jgi:hypothetical protein
MTFGLGAGGLFSPSGVSSSVEIEEATDSALVVCFRGCAGAWSVFGVGFSGASAGVLCDERFTFTNILPSSSFRLGRLTCSEVCDGSKGSSTSMPFQYSFMSSTMISCCSGQVCTSRLTMSGNLDVLNA